MNFHDICTDLTDVEFSQLNIGFNADGRLDDKHYDKLLGVMNLGLTELHKRFSLKMNHIELVFLANRYRYHLHTDHKYSDESLNVGDFRLDIGLGTLLLDTQEMADPEFIRDQPYAEFKNDILLITRVVTPKDVDLPLNDIGNPWSFITPKADVLEAPRRIVDQAAGIPDWLKMDRVYVHYRQNHERFARGAGEYDGNRVHVDLPETHRRALLLFMAARIFQPVGIGQEFNSSNYYHQQFLLECQTLTEDGLYIQQGDEGGKFAGRGFR